MISKSDKKWFITNFTSPTDLKALEDRIDKKLDEKLAEKLRFIPTKNEFFSKMDQVMGELKTIRDNEEIHAGQHADIKDDIDKIKKAINLTN